MGVAAIIPAVATLAGSYMKARSAGKAADRISQGYEAAAQAAQQALGPYAQAGLPAVERLQAGIAPGGEFAKPFSMADAYSLPAMKTALEQGRAAIEGGAAARGGLLTSNTLAGLTDYGQRVGAQYQQQAFNQFLQERQAMMDPLYRLMGVGVGAAGDIAGARGSAAIGEAQARGAADIARGNIGADLFSQLGAPSTPLGSALTSALGGGGGGGMYAAPPGMSLTPPSGGASMYGPPPGMKLGTFSDARLKTNIKRVGTTNDGLGIYSYRMRWGGPTQLGVMAQEVEQVRPDAVTTHSSGYRMVDYDKVS